LREHIISFIHNIATSNSRKKTILAPIGGTIFFLSFVVFIILSFYSDNLFRFSQFPHKPLNIILGVPVFSFGILLTFWSVLYFIRVKGTPVPFNPPSKLITTGPYMYIRNPMLTGVFLQLFGIGIFFRSISLVFIFTPIFILISILFLKAIEEPELERRLGNEYLEYKRRVPMFIPKGRPVHK